MSQTAYRTHHATEVTEQLVGQKVTLSGWVDRRRDHGGVAFIDLRDNTGLVQVVIYDEEMARPLRSEFVIQVVGEVRLRPDGNENEHLATGKIEVVAESIEVLAKSDALPFQVSTALENESENKLPGEDVRLKYRYLDLRRPSMQRNQTDRRIASRNQHGNHHMIKFFQSTVHLPVYIKRVIHGARQIQQNHTQHKHCHCDHMQMIRLPRRLQKQWQRSHHRQDQRNPMCNRTARILDSIFSDILHSAHSLSLIHI